MSIQDSVIISLRMIVVIIAGGSGTRLWPLSTPEYPKHLLKVNGSDKSLLQQTYERAYALTDKVYVVSEAGHAHYVKEQLSDLKDQAFIVEPARRGTANCIVMALVHISRLEDKSEPIAFLSADHYIRDKDGFAHSFKVASEASSKSGRIVLVGVEPDYPATGFGYIQKDGIYDEKKWVYHVDSFKEKPDHKTAKQYLSSGKYLWNCGYFVGSVDTFVDHMSKFSSQLHGSFGKLVQASDDRFNSIYLELESDTIDYALIEKVDDLLVVPASFDWMDLGSFGDLHKAADVDEASNYVSCDQIETDSVENSYIHNSEDKPVAVIGLDNVVVVNTKDGLLVTRKDLGQKVGDAAKKIIKHQENNRSK